MSEQPDSTIPLEIGLTEAIQMLNVNTTTLNSFPIEPTQTAVENSEFLLTDISNVQSVLSDLEKRSDGKAGLEQLAKQIGNFLGVTVVPQISADNRFSLAWDDSDPGLFFGKF